MKEYMNKSGITSMLSELMAKVFIEKPEDPKKFLGEEILKLEGVDQKLELSEKNCKIILQQKQIDYYKSLFGNTTDPKILIENTESLWLNVSGELVPFPETNGMDASKMESVRNSGVFLNINS